jgi:molybdopterin-guanine dinucleotide biosynthesis protein A
MGGMPKGLLPLPDGSTVLARTLDRARGLDARVVLVGRNEAYPADLPQLADAQAESGPLGGLLSLLEDAGGGPVIALACDMPYFTEELLGRLAAHPSRAPALAPKRAGRWEPLFARYDAAGCAPAVRARLARKELSLQGLLGELRADELPLLPGEHTLLEDWDRPEDVA